MAKYTVDTPNREMLDIVRRMALLAEIHDKGTANHLERIRQYCRLLGRGLELTPYEIELISTASVLHDVGKANIPHSILEKTGSLSDYEWDVIKEHAQAGADMLHGAPSVYLQTGEIIALTHHERWDGSGYPQGLEGEAIPLSGRICALADVFDALTTWRPYKHEIPTSDALVLIRESAGSIFDPELVKAFEANYDEICRLRLQNL